MYTLTFCKMVQKLTIFLLEMLKQKNLAILLASEDMEQYELTFTAGGNTKKNAKVDLEDSLAFSYNFKHSLTI